MAAFRFGVYYEYNGPTPSNVLREEKTPEEVAFALERFPIELPVCLPYEQAEVAVIDNHSTEFPLVVEIVSEAPETEIVEGVKACLRGLDLYGKRIR